MGVAQILNLTVEPPPNNKVFHEPGDLVKGSFSIEAKKDFDASEIHVSLKGRVRTNVSYTSTVRFQSNRYAVPKSAIEVHRLFKQTQSVWPKATQQDAASDTVLTAGSHDFSFSIQLPSIVKPWVTYATSMKNVEDIFGVKVGEPIGIRCGLPPTLNDFFFCQVKYHVGVTISTENSFDRHIKEKSRGLLVAPVGQAANPTFVFDMANKTGFSSAKEDASTGSFSKFLHSFKTEGKHTFFLAIVRTNEAVSKQLKTRISLATTSDPEQLINDDITTIYLHKLQIKLRSHTDIAALTKSKVKDRHKEILNLSKINREFPIMSFTKHDGLLPDGRAFFEIPIPEDLYSKDSVIIPLDVAPTFHYKTISRSYQISFKLGISKLPNSSIHTLKLSTDITIINESSKEPGTPKAAENSKNALAPDLSDTETVDTWDTRLDSIPSNISRPITAATEITDLQGDAKAKANTETGDIEKNHIKTDKVVKEKLPSSKKPKRIENLGSDSKEDTDSEIERLSKKLKILKLKKERKQRVEQDESDTDSDEEEIPLKKSTKRKISVTKKKSSKTVKKTETISEKPTKTGVLSQVKDVDDSLHVIETNVNTVHDIIKTAQNIRTVEHSIGSDIMESLGVSKSSGVKVPSVEVNDPSDKVVVSSHKADVSAISGAHVEAKTTEVTDQTAHITVNQYYGGIQNAPEPPTEQSIGQVNLTFEPAEDSQHDNNTNYDEYKPDQGFLNLPESYVSQYSSDSSVEDIDSDFEVSNAEMRDASDTSTSGPDSDSENQDEIAQDNELNENDDQGDQDEEEEDQNQDEEEEDQNQDEEEEDQNQDEEEEDQNQDEEEEDQNQDEEEEEEDQNQDEEEEDQNQDEEEEDQDEAQDEDGDDVYGDDEGEEDGEDEDENEDEN